MNNWEEEFEKEFIEKGGTDNSWLWSTKGHHPFAIMDFIRKTLISELEALKGEVSKIEKTNESNGRYNACQEFNTKIDKRIRELT